MRRRDFFRKSAVLSAGMGFTGSLFAIEKGKNTKKGIRYQVAHESIIAGVLKTIENSFLKVTLFTDASAKIQDKVNNKQWRIGSVAIQEFGSVEEGHVWMMQERSMCQQYPGRFIGKKLNEDLIEFTVIGRQNRYHGTFHCKITLDNKWLNFEVKNISDDLDSLVFPPPVESESIVIPKGIGKWEKNSYGMGIYPRYVKTFFSQMNMRWVGGIKNDASWICVFEDGFEDSFTLEANRSVAPGYMRTLGEWKHNYSVKFNFLKGTYVSQAKAYRDYFKEKGYFKSLDEKINEFPELTKMLGGREIGMKLAAGIPRPSDLEDYLFTPEQRVRRHADKKGNVHIYITFKEARNLINRYRQLGMKKGLIKIKGWINNGYDWSHPDIWPPEPKLGKVSELQDILEMKGDIIGGLHDNYQDMYEGLPSWPNGIVRNSDGSFMIGGFWAGGQSYVMHYKESIKYAKRNWEQIKTLNPRVMFCDTVTAMQLYQSYQKGNKLTKKDDRIAKEEFMKFYKDQNQLFGSEEVADFGIPYVDWFETRFNREPDNYLPLWPLVFHDAAFITRYNSGAPSPSDEYPRYLDDMLWGNYMYFNAHSGFNEEYFKSSYHVDNWHSRIGKAEMLNHKFLTEDFKVEQTEFSTGESIIVNYGNEDVVFDGVLIKAKKHKILT